MLQALRPHERFEMLRGMSHSRVRLCECGEKREKAAARTRTNAQLDGRAESDPPHALAACCCFSFPSSTYALRARA
jgi:hypothetical protein